MRWGHNVVGRPGRPRRADRNIQMPAHAAGERSNVTISKAPQESELPAPDDFSTRVLKWSGAGSALSCRPFGKSQKQGPSRAQFNSNCCGVSAGSMHILYINNRSFFADRRGERGMQDPPRTPGERGSW